MALNEVIDLLKSFVFLLKAEGIPVEKAILYGSWLYGSETADSDIDLLVVTQNGDDDHIAGKIWQLTSKINTRIEPYVIGTARFNAKDCSPLIETIKNTGLEVA